MADLERARYHHRTDRPSYCGIDSGCAIASRKSAGPSLCLACPFPICRHDSAHAKRMQTKAFTVGVFNEGVRINGLPT